MAIYTPNKTTKTKLAIIKLDFLKIDLFSKDV